MTSRFRVFAAKLSGMFGRRKADHEFDDEMRLHLQLLTERYIRQGMRPEEAASAARRQFGNTTLLQQGQREMRSIMSLSNLGRDLRFSVRQRITPDEWDLLIVAGDPGEHAELFRVFDGQGIEENFFCDSENGGVSADAQSEGGDGDEGKRWVTAELPPTPVVITSAHRSPTLCLKNCASRAMLSSTSSPSKTSR